MSDPPSTAGQAAKNLIDAELDVERTRKTSLEARGLAVITGSGTLVTLMLAVAALAMGKEKQAVSGWPEWILALSVLLFVLAACFGIAVNAPSRYFRIDPASLSGLITREEWGEPGHDAERELTAARLAELSDARTRNEKKARRVLAAISCQVVGVLFAASVVFVLVLR
ncbi:hypothetical protein ACFZDB_20900 [Streptomyces luteogriseus]|uniref:hypothetical protein n=1 Tax=Streptomyces luteogriseus TaxID=68233 RepID=UPI0033CCB076